MVAICALAGVVATAGCWINWGLAGNTLRDLETIEQLTGAQLTESSVPPCGVTLSISGGRFSPDVCQFEITVGGPYCGGPGECKPDYSIALRNSRPKINEIKSIILFNIREFKTGTYQFDARNSLADFKGQLIDEGAVVRHLLRGVVTLDRPSDDKVSIFCDLVFEHGITVQGGGLIEVKRVYAP